MMDLTEMPRTVGGWLERCGWQREGAAGWSLATTHGPAHLRMQPGASDWQAWSVHGGALLRTSNSRLLRDNRRLAGPWKFVRGRPGPSCRADLPAELLDSQPESDGVFGATPHPVETWAEMLTGLLRGQDLSPSAPAASTDLAAALVKQGWSAASDDGTVRVHIPLPGVFHQVAITQTEAGTRLTCSLVDLADYSAVSRHAALLLAHQANARLRLVRFAVEVRDRQRWLQAEIDLSRARVPGAWLDVALPAMQTAIHLTARELAALRDPELAAWTLAAQANGRKEVEVRHART